MYMVVGERIKGHKVGYTEARWYFRWKRDAEERYHKVWNAHDNSGAKMYHRVELRQLKNQMKELLP